MRRYYLRAADIAHANRDPYAFVPALNHMVAELSLDAGREGWEGLDHAALERARAAATGRAAVEPDFWCVTAVVELNLCEAVSERKLAGRAEAISREFADINARVSVPAMWAPIYRDMRLVLGKYARRISGREQAVAETLLQQLAGFSEGKSTVPAEDDNSEEESIHG
jgi:hypothetical protein